MPCNIVTWITFAMGVGVLGVVGVGGSSQVWGNELQSLTPRQVVERWCKVYPGKIEQAADLTTSSFREGASKEEWIAVRGPFLQNLGLKYVRAKIVHEELKDRMAQVLVHAHIVTAVGDQPQDERYVLVRSSEGRWLIDQVEIYTETFNRVP